MVCTADEGPLPEMSGQYLTLNTAFRYNAPLQVSLQLPLQTWIFVVDQ